MVARVQPESERRAHERIAHSSDVHVVRGDLLLEGLSKDLAAGGMCLVLGEPAPIRVGDELTLRFQLPRLDTATETRGCVRWLGGPDNSLIGIQFTQGLRAREVWAINQLEAHGEDDY